MHPTVFTAFGDVCAELRAQRQVPEGPILELGASPHHRSLLTLSALPEAPERIGIGLDGAVVGDGFTIHTGNTHDLSRFPNATFALVLSNALLEHDAQFWLTVAEAHRVLAPGGWFVCGVPGYGRMGMVPTPPAARYLARIPRAKRRLRTWRSLTAPASLTLGIHNYPGDYYRFSEQSMREVILGGMTDISTRTVMDVPRIIGAGRKSVATA
ncbi:MAG: methyltransferase domain-containing protein [Candidatus Nanopelagicales bacterium]